MGLALRLSGAPVLLALTACGSLFGVDFDDARPSGADASVTFTTAADASSEDAATDPPRVDARSSADAGCAPDDAADCARKCGAVRGRCGTLLACRACPSGQTCGGGGPNVCGVTACVPSCSAKACGASDGCSGVCTQGACPAGSSCVSGTCRCDPSTCPPTTDASTTDGATSPGTNLAREAGASATASSVNPGYPGSNAVDGSLGASWFAASNTCPGTAGGGNYSCGLTAVVTVTLAGVRTVRELRVFGSRDFPNGYDALTARWEILDAAGAVLRSQPVALPAPDRDATTVLAPAVVGARSVRFVVETSETRSPTIGELEIYGN